MKTGCDLLKQRLSPASVFSNSSPGIAQYIDTCFFAPFQNGQIGGTGKRTGVDSSIPLDLLWRTIHALADLGVYLDSTNHLSDRELYSTLWQTQLRTDYPINPYPEEFPMVSCIDILGGWSNEDLRTYLKYYADEEERARPAVLGDNEPISEHVDPPYQRDHLLPRGV